MSNAKRNTMTTPVLPLGPLRRIASLRYFFSLSRPRVGTRTANRAFTLIELLVVVGIIALLAAILFPVFSRVRENGRRAACQSNLKQIGMALLQYSQDYDETLIADWYGTNGASEPASSGLGEYKWNDAAYPYIKSEAVFNCPSQSFDSGFGPYVYYGRLTGADTKYGSYAIVHGYGAYDGTRTPPVSHPAVDGSANQHVLLSQAATPVTTAWVMDGLGNFCIVVGDSNFSPQVRHLDTLNVLFLDGHVKAMKREALEQTNSDGTIRAYTLQDD